MPIITSGEFLARRQFLFSQLISPSCALLYSGDLSLGPESVQFSPNRDFYYLTGIAEPGFVILFLKINNNQKLLLFRPYPTDDEKLWSGPFLEDSEINNNFLDDNFEIYPVAQIENILENIFRDDAQDPNFILYHSFSHAKKLNKILYKLLKNCVINNLKDLLFIIHEMRLIKSQSEIEIIKTAVDISCEAQLAAMQICKPDLYEYSLQAEISYRLQKNGCLTYPYYPIVAAGSNGLILHYEKNNKKLLSGELVLVDAAGEYQFYAADITRTYPVNGQFTTEQRAIYNLVLTAQQQSMSYLSPNYNRDDFYYAQIKIITQGLIDLKILQGDLNGLIETKAYRQFYYHGPGHWIGLAVHDVGSYKINNKPRNFKKNMVMTNEPGLYFQPQDNLDPKWWNIAVRIEDMVLITENQPVILSQNLPKESAEIEAIIKNKK